MPLIDWWREKVFLVIFFLSTTVAGVHGYELILSLQDADADKQSLVISRVMPEIIEVGNIAEYQVSLEGDDNKVVAETTFGLQIDGEYCSL